MGSSKKHSEADNQHIETLLRSGTSPKTIHRTLPHISRTNIYLRAQRYKQCGTSLVSADQRRRSGPPKKVTPEIEDLIRELVEREPDVELRTLVGILERERGLVVSTSSLSRVLARLVGGRGKGLKSRRLGEQRRRGLLMEIGREMIGNAGAGAGAGSKDVSERGRKGKSDAGLASDVQVLDPALIATAIGHDRSQTVITAYHPLPVDGQGERVATAVSSFGTVATTTYKTPYLPVQIPREVS